MNTGAKPSDKNGKKEEESDINSCGDDPVFDH